MLVRWTQQRHSQDVFVLKLAITAVAALLQSHAHSTFAYSPFEPEKTKALKEFGISCGTVPEYVKANSPYLKDPLWG